MEDGKTLLHKWRQSLKKPQGGGGALGCPEKVLVKFLNALCQMEGGGRYSQLLCEVQRSQLIALQFQLDEL